MRIVVTGASGNLGTALLRRLAADDEAHDVVGIVRRPPQAGADYAGVEWHALDLADDDAAARLRGIVEGADAVVHLAWLFQPSRDIDYLRKATVGGSRAVLDAATEAGVGHLVHLSSLGAYSPGPKDRAVDESWPTGGSPTLPYSRHKVEVEPSRVDRLDPRTPGECCRRPQHRGRQVHRPGTEGGGEVVA
ncbi:MAG: NAD-dependent epimerase/dehydratase family protein, partial [Actinomycetota bacterium]|nr:NAD-dependent epimerase/dehydratase family protein [Actinomycetota bacterium]